MHLSFQKVLFVSKHFVNNFLRPKKLKNKLFKNCRLCVCMCVRSSEFLGSQTRSLASREKVRKKLRGQIKEVTNRLAYFSTSWLLSPPFTPTSNHDGGSFHLASCANDASQSTCKKDEAPQVNSAMSRRHKRLRVSPGSDEPRSNNSDFSLKRRTLQTPLQPAAVITCKLQLLAIWVEIGILTFGFKKCRLRVLRGKEAEEKERRKRCWKLRSFYLIILRTNPEIDWFVMKFCVIWSRIFVSYDHVFSRDIRLFPLVHFDRNFDFGRVSKGYRCRCNPSTTLRWILL